jgi:hypothetical protein
MPQIFTKYVKCKKSVAFFSSNVGHGKYGKEVKM